MSYDPVLAERVRDLLFDAPDLVEMKMFGGIGWTIRGNMAAGAHSHGELMLRCSKEDFHHYLAQPGVSPMKRGETPITGWLRVDPAFVEDDADLERWVAVGRDYASSLPPKVKKPKPAKKPKLPKLPKGN
ncbi:MAG: TfoX/Sxy family protein [Myxococcota bacterium]